MVTSDEIRNATLDRVFGALADPTRRALMARLARGDASVGELAEPFEISRPAISKHLDVLERAGLVHRMPHGRVNRCRLDGVPLLEALMWMGRYRAYWESQLDGLARYLETEGIDGPAGTGSADTSTGTSDPRRS